MKAGQWHGFHGEQRWKLTNKRGNICLLEITSLMPHVYNSYYKIYIIYIHAYIDADILNSVQKENKLYHLLGDLNIDLFKHDVHRPTSEFLDTIYSYNVYPLVTKPTRVTASSATPIDHILSNNIDVSYGHTQDILCTSISDHFAVFHIAGNMSTSKLTQPVSPKLRRDMRRENIEKFSTEMQKINWNNLLCINDTQSAYSTFHKMLSDVYDKCLPYKKIDKPYYNKKTWLTLALK